VSVLKWLRLAALVQGNALQARADTAYSTEWDVQEQATLDGTLARYPADRHPPLERYVRAAAGLPKKCAGGHMFKIDARLQAQALPSLLPYPHCASGQYKQVMHLAKSGAEKSRAQDAIAGQVRNTCER